MNIKFPIYELRKYTEIVWEDEYRVIETSRAKYVLDINTTDTEYSARRLELYRRDLPYPIYPLTNRLTTLQGIVESKYKKFIDCTGGVLVWKPTKFFKVICHKVQNRWRTDTGNWIVSVDGNTFRVPEGAYTHAQLIHIGDRRILYGMCSTMLKPTRKKL